MMVFHCAIPKQRRNKSGITLKTNDNDGIVIMIPDAMFLFKKNS